MFVGNGLRNITEVCELTILSLKATTEKYSILILNFSVVAIFKFVLKTNLEILINGF